jgi:putative Mn2+ efflux pump MntP
VEPLCSDEPRMSLGSIFLVALGLAMDSTAVAASRGLAARRILPRDVALVALCFGGFQALMPLLGWLVGARVGEQLSAVDHWIAFALLGGIGGKMLWEARGGADEPRLDASNDLFAFHVLCGLGLATSIDALAVGFTLPLLGAPLLVSLATIGLTTAVLSAAGLFAGRRFGALLGRRLDALGGIVLIGLGIKILVEHLSAS